MWESWVNDDKVSSHDVVAVAVTPMAKAVWPIVQLGHGPKNNQNFPRYNPKVEETEILHVIFYFVLYLRKIDYLWNSIHYVVDITQKESQQIKSTIDALAPTQDSSRNL